MDNLNGIQGLTSLSKDERNVVISGGRFALPAGFDSRKYASMWVMDGPQVQEAKQDEVLHFAGCKAQGWEVHKIVGNLEEISAARESLRNLKGKELEDAKSQIPTPKLTPCTRSVGKNTYVLMFRPKELQQAVNQIYANQSRAMVNAEIDGETKSADLHDDPGILTNADIRKFDRSMQDEENAGGYLKGVGSMKTPIEAVTLNLG